MAEFNELQEGWRWREKREMRRLAQLASWVTAPHVKRPVDPEELIRDPNEKKKTTPQETAQILSELEDQMGVN
jgi:hypothetical protein